MGSPPPPPAHHGYGHAGPRDLQSAFSERSGRYSDNYSQYSDIQFADRPASRTPSSRTTSSTNSNSNKTYLYYHLQRGENGWSGARRYEINASQDEIKKKAKSKSKSGIALEQLERMGKTRHDQIENLRAYLNALETDGSSWENVFMEVTKSKASGNSLKVTEFNVIFQRRTPRPDPSRRQSKVSFGQEVPAQVPIFTQQPTTTTSVNRGARVPKQDDYLRTPFANVPLFDRSGQPVDANGPVLFTKPGMPNNIPTEKPIAQMLPKIHTQPNSNAAATQARKQQARVQPGDALDIDALLGDTHAGDPDGVITVGDEHHQARPRPVQRRQSSAQRSSNGGRYGHVNVETRHPEFYTSNRSSWASEEGSVMYGEVDELSSRTSEDTRSSHHSPARKTYRTSAHARHSSGQHSPASPRFRGGDTLVLPERTRRQTPVDAQKPLYGAVEQISHKRNTSKPMVVQTLQPRPYAAQPGAVPPTAEYPSYYTKQDNKEHRVDNYIRGAQQDQAKKTREAELARREREVERQRREFDDKKTSAPRPVEVTAGGRKRYTYEPRDVYGH